jgi:hypothetical protein
MTREEYKTVLLSKGFKFEKPTMSYPSWRGDEDVYTYKPKYKFKFRVFRMFKDRPDYGLYAGRGSQFRALNALVMHNLNAEGNDKPLPVWTEDAFVELMEKIGSSSSIKKFSKEDRQLVVNTLQQVLDIKLEQLSGISPRLYRIKKSKFNEMYLVIGGIGNWHGIKEDQLNDIVHAYRSMNERIYSRYGVLGVLILAEKNQDKIDIFRCSLNEFLNSRDRLIVNYENDHQFHHERTGDTVRIKEIPNLELDLVASVPLKNLEDGVDVIYGATEDILEQSNLTDVEHALKQYSSSCPPDRAEQVVYRVVRNSKIARLIKESRDYVCEVCGREPFIQKNGKPYAEADHIRPLGGEYRGFDSPENMRCLCAQCHAVITHGSEQVIRELLGLSKWQQ